MEHSTESDAQETQRQLSRFVRVLACFQKALGHELPNQLVAAQGLVQLLREEEAGHLSAEGRDGLERLAAVLRRTHSLVRELSDLGRAMRQDSAGGEAHVGEAVEEVVAGVKQLSPGRSVAYHLVDPGAAVPLSDAVLRRVLAGLLGFLVRRHPDRPLRVEIGAREAGAGMELWVSGDGPPPTPVECRSLVEPFAGADSGPGLGLFLCSLLVDGCGGTLELEAPSAGGTRFLLRLPRTDRRLEGLVTEG
jgi:signal transduction histidine kinase